MKINDVVETLIDIPDLEVLTGTRGAIVEIYTEPRPAYEVEFVYEGLRDPETTVLRPEDVRLVWSSPVGPEG